MGSYRRLIPLLVGVILIGSIIPCAFADDSQCVLTGGTVLDGDCNTADLGCCDLASECLDDGTCELPPPVCTTDSSCDDAEDFCLEGIVCASPDDIELTPYTPGSSPYLGVVLYDFNEYFLVGTGDISSGSYVVNKIVSFDEEEGANLNVVLDGSGRPLYGYYEGNEDQVWTFVYDVNGNLVSAVEFDGGNVARERKLLSLRDSTPVLHSSLRRRLGVLQLIGGAVVCWAVSEILDLIQDSLCPPGDGVCGEPHMQGLRSQRIDWSGIDGGWYSMIKDDNADLHINVRLTAPLLDEFPDRQLMTSLSVLSEGHSLTVEVKNPYTIETDGCSENVTPCLANGGLRIVVDGQEVDELLGFSRQVQVADGAISVSASNLPVECRQFGGDKIWARMYEEMLEGRRQLAGGESLEDWILRFDYMAAPGWCAKFIAENNLADLQSTHAIFKIETPTVTVRLNAGVNFQGDGELDWDGRVLPDLKFWQMDVGMTGLDMENPELSGLLGETAHPVYDQSGNKVMEGFEAFRGTVEDYRVSSALGTHFPLLDKKGEGHK